MSRAANILNNIASYMETGEGNPELPIPAKCMSRDLAWKEWCEQRSDRNQIVGQLVTLSKGNIAKTFNAHDEDSYESDGSSSSQPVKVDRRERRNHDDSMYSSPEDSVRSRKKEAAGDVSMQDKEQTEQTETGALSQETADRSIRDKQQTTEQAGSGTEEPRLRPGSKAARTPRKRNQGGSGTLLRHMNNLESKV